MGAPRGDNLFNDILTGKASLEPPPLTLDPYRQESVPDISRPCVDCQQPFTTKADSGATRCSRCHLALVDRNAAESARAFADSAALLRGHERSTWWSRTLWLVICGLLLIAFKIAMRRQLREDMREMHGLEDTSWQYHFDPYVDQVRSFATQMCFCEDLKCARGVQRQFDYWVRSTTDQPRTDGAREAVRVEAERLAGCLAAQ